MTIMAMFFDIAVGDTLLIGEAVVSLQQKTGKKARLKIEAPGNVGVKKELVQKDT